jgi:dTDP-4-dehydrorhamnose reductase
LNNNKFDVLIHTAISGGRRTKEENGDVVYENLLMFEILMKFSNKFKLIINFDSGAIYDRSTDIYCKKESEELNVPRDYYGFSKYLIYKRSLQYDNIVNFRIFNIFHVNEEPDRFIKSCFLAKKNGTNVSIFQDKYFDFMYEDDFVKIIKFYFDHIEKQSVLEKTINICYNTKYKLSDIAYLIIGDYDKMKIIKKDSDKNYCGDNQKLNQINIEFLGLEKSLAIYDSKFID